MTSWHTSSGVRFWKNYLGYVTCDFESGIQEWFRMWGPFLAVLRSSRGPGVSERPQVARGTESVWLGVKEER